MRVITLLDTATCSTNLGDRIIMAAVREEVAAIVEDAFVYSVPTHEYMGRKSRSLLARADDIIVGGSNLLSSRMWFKPLWKLTPLDMIRGYDITLMGVGWYQFQPEPDLYSRLMLRRVLTPNGLQSVRDSYARTMLQACGITNVVNTGCPTLWRLTPDHCTSLPRSKSDYVVTTLNTYMPDPDSDRRLMQILRERYSRVYFWSQTESDREYARRLGEDLIQVEPSLAGLDQLLESNLSIDYVGNRLHAGIRALQKGRRAVIVEIDNRAREMGRDFGLPTVGRQRFERLSKMIEEPFATEIELPVAEIDSWRDALSSRARSDTRPGNGRTR